ncbi:unnamed protein product [Danaus chrysippus]|uniref:Selenoprotein O n=1 Tax=Danaus chrysippus TaxID=151541 RepID=A0A8J2MJ20_9NEOP|nr:unnamed protein product [Danaus chrysippus]
MKMEGESTTVKENLNEWRFSLHPKYILLPIDENHDQVKNNVKNVIYSEVNAVTPHPLEKNLRLVCSSGDALTNILDMSPEIVNTGDFLEFVGGRRLPCGSLPVAHRYGGHQYGLWVGQLGDGRAHLIGEYVNRLCERWQVQLKGSGLTPYSRSYDGRCVLRAAIREMVASEAMFHLGVPTTRTAAVVASDDTVVRDLYYSGNPHREKTAILLRLSQCWFRFGSLEILAKGGELAILKQVTDFIIKEHFPDIHLSDENRFIRLFSEIAHRSLDLVAKWQGLGFTHGLLNTDNMSILGVTMDYGPFGFVDSYDGGFVSNSSDGEGRYSLSKQPDIVAWNIGQLANALKPLLSSSQQVHMTHILKTLDTYCKNKILETFLMKIGLKKERWGDEELVEKLLDMMQHTGADFTTTFRQLSELEPHEMVTGSKLEEKWSLKRLSSHSSWGCWLDQYRERLDKESVDSSSSCVFSVERVRRMRLVNPAYVPRTWLIHEAIQDAERDDFTKLRFLLQVIQNPYEVQPEAEARGFSNQPPQWAYALKISCSS